MRARDRASDDGGRLVGPRDPGRRAMLRAAGALAVSLPEAAGAALVVSGPGDETPFPNGATLLVAGPRDGSAGQWAHLLLPALRSSLPPATDLQAKATGGADGVTGANEFATRVAPDGTTALLVPGAAGRAWLVGDPRVHFDPGQWVPTMVALLSGVLAVRPQAAGRLRVASGGPVEASLPAVLGLDLLGRRFDIVGGLGDPAAASRAFVGGEVDAVLLTGRDVPARLAALGGVPLFTLGTLTAEGRPVRDPALAPVPALPELFRRRWGVPIEARPLGQAWLALAATARLDVAMTLPQLSQASLVSLWRRACADAIGDLSVQSAARAQSVRPLPAPAATPDVRAMIASESAQLALRRWLSARLDWRPS